MCVLFDCHCSGHLFLVPFLGMPKQSRAASFSFLKKYFFREMSQAGMGRLKGSGFVIAQ